MAAVTSRRTRRLGRRRHFQHDAPRNVSAVDVWIGATEEIHRPGRISLERAMAHAIGPTPLATDPTPEEIAAACGALQATWEPLERLKRRIYIGEQLDKLLFPSEDGIGPPTPGC